MAAGIRQSQGHFTAIRGGRRRGGCCKTFSVFSNSFQYIYLKICQSADIIYTSRYSFFFVLFYFIRLLQVTPDLP